MTELIGLGASLGTGQGPVRIVKTRGDLQAFTEGEVLVTEMTSPEYLTAMAKASAIVTDKGGITCHAAIVSREFGTPCVVGTVNATKRLRTSDRATVTVIGLKDARVTTD